jgi:hypothetical protein
MPEGGGVAMARASGVVSCYWAMIRSEASEAVEAVWGVAD